VANADRLGLPEELEKGSRKEFYGIGRTRLSDDFEPQAVGLDHGGSSFGVFPIGQSELALEMRTDALRAFLFAGHLELRHAHVDHDVLATVVGSVHQIDHRPKTSAVSETMREELRKLTCLNGRERTALQAAADPHADMVFTDRSNDALLDLVMRAEWLTFNARTASTQEASNREHDDQQDIGSMGHGSSESVKRLY
jgi:hypothetical protein